MDFEKAYEYAISKLGNGLPDYLHYHNVGHTEKVTKDVELLAHEEYVGSEELIMLKTAAAFHDIGFIKSYFDNEKIGAKMAADVLKGFEYNEAQIEIIQSLIMSTIFPGKPETHLEMIICDADLLYVGENSFKKVADGLRFEFEHVGIIKNEEQWLKLQVDFLSNFHFRTGSAIRIANAGLVKNRQEAIDDYEAFLNQK